MTRTGRVGVGIIGAGMISDQYLTHLTRYPDVEVLTVADLDTDRAATQASRYGIANSGDVASVSRKQPKGVVRGDLRSRCELCPVWCLGEEAVEER